MVQRCFNSKRFKPNKKEIGQKVMSTNNASQPAGERDKTLVQWQCVNGKTIYEITEITENKEEELSDKLEARNLAKTNKRQSLLNVQILPENFEVIVRESTLQKAGIFDVDSIVQQNMPRVHDISELLLMRKKEQKNIQMILIMVSKLKKSVLLNVQILPKTFEDKVFKSTLQKAGIVEINKMVQQNMPSVHDRSELFLMRSREQENVHIISEMSENNTKKCILNVQILANIFEDKVFHSTLLKSRIVEVDTCIQNVPVIAEIREAESEKSVGLIRNDVKDIVFEQMLTEMTKEHFGLNEFNIVHSVQSEKMVKVQTLHFLEESPFNTTVQCIQSMARVCFNEKTIIQDTNDITRYFFKTKDCLEILKEVNISIETDHINAIVFKAREKEKRKPSSLEKVFHKLIENDKINTNSIQIENNEDAVTFTKDVDMIGPNGICKNVNKMKVFGVIEEVNNNEDHAIKTNNVDMNETKFGVEMFEENDPTEICSDVLKTKVFEDEEITIETNDVDLNVFEGDVDGVQAIENNVELSIDIRTDILDLNSSGVETKEKCGHRRRTVYPAALEMEELKSVDTKTKQEDILIEAVDISTDVVEVESTEGVTKVDILIGTTGICTDIYESKELPSLEMTEKDLDNLLEVTGIRTKIFQREEIEEADSLEIKVDVLVEINEDRPNCYPKEKFYNIGSLSDRKHSEITMGIEFIRAFESRDFGDHSTSYSHMPMRSIDDIQKDRDQVLTNLSQSVESSIAEMNALKSAIEEMAKHLKALEQDLIEKDLCVRDYRKQIDDLEFETIALQSEISILENDREALINNSPYPHWLTIFDLSSQSPHVGTEEDQAILDEMENCPTKAHLSRKDLTLAMIDRLIDLRHQKVGTAIQQVTDKQRTLSGVLNSRVAIEACYQGLLTTAGRISRRLSKARRTFDVEIIKSRREIRDVVQRPRMKEVGPSSAVST